MVAAITLIFVTVFNYYLSMTLKSIEVAKYIGNCFIANGAPEEIVDGLVDGVIKNLMAGEKDEISIAGNEEDDDFRDYYDYYFINKKSDTTLGLLL